MDVNKASVLARECGFEIVGPLDIGTLELRPEVRDMCSFDLCPQGYGRSWSCPPAVPPLEEISTGLKDYSQGILVQTIGRLEDPFDFEAIMNASRSHGKNFSSLAEKMAEETGDKSLSLGAGACSVCPSCTYPDDPCRYPDKMIVSMEASGLMVNDVCRANGLLYNNGEKTVTYTSCCLF